MPDEPNSESDGPRHFQADIPDSMVTPQEALRLLLEGNRRFVAGESHAHTTMERRATFAAGQSPMAAVLCCADSRVTPEIIFDQPLGEIFSIRVAGNFLHDEGLASLEYAVLKLGIALILVLGHTDCGAVKAAMHSLEDPTPLPGKLPALVASLLPAVHQALAKNPKHALAACIQENVRFEARAIAGAQPVIAPMVEAGRLLVAGGVVTVETGVVAMLDSER